MNYKKYLLQKFDGDCLDFIISVYNQEMKQNIERPYNPVGYLNTIKNTKTIDDPQQLDIIIIYLPDRTHAGIMIDSERFIHKETRGIFLDYINCEKFKHFSKRFFRFDI